MCEPALQLLRAPFLRALVHLVGREEERRSRAGEVVGNRAHVLVVGRADDRRVGQARAEVVVDELAHARVARHVDERRVALRQARAVLVCEHVRVAPESARELRAPC